MAICTCNECKHYFKNEEEQAQGDCVRRLVDPRQGYYTAQPVEECKEAGSCVDFSKR